MSRPVDWVVEGQHAYDCREPRMPPVDLDEDARREWLEGYDYQAARARARDEDR
jgi:hypothetical protein